MSASSGISNIPVVVYSKRRISGTASDFKYKLNKGVSKIRRISLTSATIPFSFYTVSALNTTLVLNDGANIVTIAAGAYNLSNFQIALQNGLNNASPVINSGFTVSYNTSTGKITINNTSTNFIINSLSSQLTSTLAPIIGFTSDSASGTTAVADSVLNLSSTQFLYISSKKLCTFYVSEKPRYFNDDLIYSIGLVQIDTAFGNFINTVIPFNVDINNPNGLVLTEDDEIDFYLSDDSGNIIDLNGTDWLCTLNFEKY